MRHTSGQILLGNNNLSYYKDKRDGKYYNKK